MGTLGAKRGVRRGRFSNGLIYVNGHPPIPRELADKILKLLSKSIRPMTAREIALLLGYTRDHISHVCRDMTTDGELVMTPGWSRVPATFEPVKPDGARWDGSEPDTKRCTGCGEVLPLDRFHRDANSSDGRQTRCRGCRSRKPTSREVSDMEIVWD